MNLHDLSHEQLLAAYEEALADDDLQDLDVVAEELARRQQEASPKPTCCQDIQLFPAVYLYVGCVSSRG